MLPEDMDEDQTVTGYLRGCWLQLLLLAIMIAVMYYLSKK